MKNNPDDPRSKKGMFSRGKNVYNGASSRPNPDGINQYPTPVGSVQPEFETDNVGNVKKLTGQELQDAAKLKLKRRGK